MTEIEKVKAQLKVLEKKLALLEELEKTKTPAEEAYKNTYGFYPKGRGNGLWTIGDDWGWQGFQAGYEFAYAISTAKEVMEKVQEEQEEEPEELKTLYQMLDDKKHDPDTCVFICDIVKEWMSQYTHNVMTGEYLKGYEECLTVLEENLK